MTYNNMQEGKNVDLDAAHGHGDNYKRNITYWASLYNH